MKEKKQIMKKIGYEVGWLKRCLKKEKKIDNDKLAFVLAYNMALRWVLE